MLFTNYLILACIYCGLTQFSTIVSLIGALTEASAKSFSELDRLNVGWCHVVCALYIPEAWFGNVQTMEPIILKGLPPERFNKVSNFFFHIIISVS